MDTDPRPDAEPGLAIARDGECGPAIARADRTDAALPQWPAEPDYRFTLANERTFLAWERTALGLLAAAVATVQLVPELAIPWARHAVGAVLGALAVLTAGAGLYRWRRVDAAMRAGRPLPRNLAPVIVGCGLVIVATLGVLLLIR